MPSCPPRAFGRRSAAGSRPAAWHAGASCRGRPGQLMLLLGSGSSVPPAASAVQAVPAAGAAQGAVPPSAWGQLLQALSAVPGGLPTVAGLCAFALGLTAGLLKIKATLDKRQWQVGICTAGL